MKPSLHLVRLTSDLSIFDQLEIEEALLRASDEAWCIVKNGSSIPSIVLGISANVHEMVDTTKLPKESPIQIIRRFSGGGTVIVDENSLFFTIILSKNSIPKEYHYPKEFMKWVYELIHPAFLPHSLTLEENDFVLSEKKVGGNAQCFTQHRMLHHTSFLWKWNEERMNLLHHPKKIPNYRQNRSHNDFCGALFPYYSSQDSLMKNLELALHNHFQIHECTPSSPHVQKALLSNHRKALSIVSV